MIKKILLTFAQSLDGMIATSTGESKYISEEGSLKLNQEMRRDHDAILVGIGTVLTDNPLLTCRIDHAKNPLRVILDPSLRLPADSRLAETAEKYSTLVFYDESGKNQDKSAIKAKIKILESQNITLKGIRIGADGRLSLEEVLKDLGERGVDSLMVEGGSAVLTSFLRNNLWTDMIIVSAPKIIGKGINSFEDIGIKKLAEAVKPEVKNISIIGTEVCWHLTRAETIKNVSARTVFFTAPDSVEVRTVPIESPGSDYTLFSSRLMAISPGTERQYYKGNFLQGKKADPAIDCTEGEFTYPFSYGYINVVEDSSGKRYFGFLHHAEKVFARREDLYPLTESISDESALFLPHMETAVSIIHDTKPKLGDRVLITGAGLIGTLTQRILSEKMGIETVVFDLNPGKKLWFENNNFCSDINELTCEAPFDICIEASGNPGGLQTCIDFSQINGSVTVAGWYGEQQIPIKLGGIFHWKRLRLISSQVSNISPSLGHNWNKTRRLDLCSELLGKIKTEDLLTHHFPINDAPEAYKLICGNNAFYGLVALLPGG